MPGGYKLGVSTKWLEDCRHTNDGLIIHPGCSLSLVIIPIFTRDSDVLEPRHLPNQQRTSPQSLDPESGHRHRYSDLPRIFSLISAGNPRKLSRTETWPSNAYGCKKDVQGRLSSNPLLPMSVIFKNTKCFQRALVETPRAPKIWRVESEKGGDGPLVVHRSGSQIKGDTKTCPLDSIYLRNAWLLEFWRVVFAVNLLNWNIIWWI